MRSPLLLPLVGLAFLTGCGSDQAVRYDSRVPLRVAVLPFTEEHAGDLVTSVPFATIVDAVPIIGRDDRRDPATVFRWRFLARLRGMTNLDAINPGFVDTILLQHGLYEGAAFLDADPRSLGDLLGADAILTGRVTDWDRVYLGAETIQTVGLAVEMVGTLDGVVLWEATGRASDDSGLSGGPTGYTSLIAEPIRGLSGKKLYELADRVCFDLVEPLGRGPDGLDDSLPPPFIAASAAAPQGTVAPGRRVEVVAVGSPDCLAGFRIGESDALVPMTEVADGVYVGTLVVEGDQSARVSAIEIRLVGPSGRVTLQRIDG